MNSCNWIKTLQDEIEFIHYHMVDADKRRKVALPQEKRLYNETYKLYKRALWDTMNAHKKSINSIRY